MATDAEGILEIDLRRSRLEFLKRAQLPLELRHHPLDPSALRRYAERLGKYERELSSGRYVNLAMQGEAYWLALLCGIDQFVRKGGLDDDNVYLTWLARGLLSRMVDPGMRHLLDNRVALHRWVSGRLHAISRVLQRGDASLFSEIPIAFNTTPSHPDLDALGLSSLAIRGSDEHLSVAMIDGHHRLFAMALLDVERCPMMSVWNPALLQEVPKLKRIRNYEQRMFQYLAGVTVDDPITA